VLAGRLGPAQAVQHWAGGGVDVLASGPLPPNPSELLASKQMARLLSELRAEYDTVLIDTPPLLPVTDAAVMATVADGCLLVSRHAKTTVSQASTAAAALAAVSAKLHGCVLNMIPAKAAGTYAYYSYTATDDTAAPAVPPQPAIPLQPAAPTQPAVPHQPTAPPTPAATPLSASPFRQEYTPTVVRSERRSARHGRLADPLNSPTTDLRAYRRDDGHYEGQAAVPEVRRRK
jgi:hypothetical protein